MGGRLVLRMLGIRCGVGVGRRSAFDPAALERIVVVGKNRPTESSEI